MIQKGSISIYLSVLLVSVLLTISSGVALLILNQSKMSSQIGHSVVSFYAAESGVERCLFNVRQGSGSCSYTNIRLDFDSGATYTVSYNGGIGIISASGSFFETNREIEVNL